MNHKNLMFANRILLGLLMLVPGFTKLLNGSEGVSGMLSGIFLFSWASGFWAWVLILSEIVFGIAILANWKVEKTKYPPVIILTVAVLFVIVKWGDIGSTPWSSLIFHLLAIVDYLMLKSK